MNPCSAQPADGGACPGDERLLAHLIAARPEGAVSAARRAATLAADGVDVAIDAHLLDCDPCVARLRVAHARLQRNAGPAEPLPAAVAARLRPSSRRPVSPRRGAATRRWGRSLGISLLPAAAAVTLLVYGGSAEHFPAPQPEEQTREVAQRQPARTTAAAAEVRTSPLATGPAVARIARGTTVFLLAEHDGWYQVELGDGTPGWMEKRAFE